MIFYFTGTGNSLWAAKQLSKAFNEKIISIADELNRPGNKFSYSLNENEKVFFVYPVHSWGPAVLITGFIKKIKLLNYNTQDVYSVSTCGDNCGYTNKIINKALLSQSITLTQAYSIQMPNNYILMKGFGIDSKEVEKEKLKKAPDLLQEITTDIQSHSSKEIYIYGGKPFLKSRIVYPLFCKYAIGHNKFYATDDCISCGLCEEVCPTKTISLINGKPEWKSTCIQCTACIHRCPVRAIEYGNITQAQGRYVHPDL